MAEKATDGMFDKAGGLIDKMTGGGAMPMPSLTGGDARSSAMSRADGYITMNSPFTIGGSDNPYITLGTVAIGGLFLWLILRQ